MSVFKFVGGVEAEKNLKRAFTSMIEASSPIEVSARSY